MWFRRAMVGLAAFVILTTTGLRLASAAALDAVAHCCCGDHSVGDRCHCPDCPADRVDGDRREPTQPTLDCCFVEDSSELTVLLPVFDERAPVGAVAAPRRTLIPRVESHAAPPAPAFAPPYEPPR